MTGQILQEQPFFVCAGIGSWQGFLASINQTGIAVGAHTMFPDHHDYSLDDIKKIMETMLAYDLRYVITTEKDWGKIRPLLSKIQFHDTFSWYVLRVEFSFLSNNEHDIFMALMKKQGIALT